MKIFKSVGCMVTLGILVFLGGCVGMAGCWGVSAYNDLATGKQEVDAR